MLIFVVLFALVSMAACTPSTPNTPTPPNINGDTDMTNTTKINYIELPVADMAASKAFYAAAFNWSYIDYGPTYASFQGAGIDGGLDANSDRKPGKDGALVILHSKDLEAAQTSVEAAGGKITVPIFSFPGGRRFHFSDPNGNELAVWTTIAE